MLTRRRFLSRAALGVACSVGAHPLITPVAMAAVPGEARLVVIILRGAMDGLDIVRPVSDPRLKELRPGLLAGARGLALNAGFELHPALSKLEPLWRAGDLAFAHAVSTPYRDQRSHFVGQDVLEAGLPGAEGIRDGWLNRLLGAIPGSTGETAYSVGGEMPVLFGPERHFSWTPGTRIGLSSQGQRLLEALYHDDPAFGDPAMAAIRIAAADDAGGAEHNSVEDLATFAAARLAGETRICSFSISGWDTHRTQEKAIRTPLGSLQAAILRLQQGLGPVWEKTAVLAMTEFGRTVRENGSGGTDHGTAGVMLLAGGAVRGPAVHGTWPGLGDGDLFEDRDLLPTEDVRGYAAKALNGLFGIDRTTLERDIFPSLDMSAVPDILA